MIIFKNHTLTKVLKSINQYYNKNKSRRIKRGLFKPNDGIFINSYVNGSHQIIKKVVQRVFANGIEGVGLHSIRVNKILIS